jgi:hypothetical protein
MARTIEFDVEALIGKLDVLQKVQLPYAGNRALWALKPKLQTVLQQEMLQRFKAPVRLTLNSPFMRIDGLEMEVSIKPDKVAKGNDPASYLYPVTAESGRGGGSREAYPTKFTRVLRNADLIGPREWPVPFLRGNGVQTRNGRMIPSQYATTLRALTGGPMGKRQAQWRYFVSRDGDGKPKRGKQFKPGIYRVKGGEVQKLFSIVQSRSAPVIFPFGDVVQREAGKILPSLLSKALADALR